VRGRLTLQDLLAVKFKVTAEVVYRKTSIDGATDGIWVRKHGNISECASEIIVVDDPLGAEVAVYPENS